MRDSSTVVAYDSYIDYGKIVDGLYVLLWGILVLLGM